MIVTDKNNKSMKATKTRKPKMTMHRGASWDIYCSLFADGQKVSVWLDTTRGWYGYFEYEGGWYKVALEDFDY